MIRIKNEELIKELIGKPKEFPKYTSPIINLANQYAQGTRPRVVGQLSELIQECPEKTYEGWKSWYLEKYPNAIDNAKEKIFKMVQELKKAINLINKEMVDEWVEDLVLEKTFIGLRFQEAILRKIASQFKKSYRLANPEEESKGIDGFIGNMPISIKPITYNAKKSLSEEIKYKIIFYKKVKNGIEINENQLK